MFRFFSHIHSDFVSTQSGRSALALIFLDLLTAINIYIYIFFLIVYHSLTNSKKKELLCLVV